MATTTRPVMKRRVRDLRTGDLIADTDVLGGRSVRRVEPDGGDHYAVVWTTDYASTVLPGELRLVVIPAPHTCATCGAGVSGPDRDDWRLIADRFTDAAQTVVAHHFADDDEPPYTDDVDTVCQSCIADVIA